MSVARRQLNVSHRPNYKTAKKKVSVVSVMDANKYLRHFEEVFVTVYQHFNVQSFLSHCCPVYTSLAHHFD